MKGKGSRGEAKQVHRVGQKGKDVMPCCGLAGYDTHHCLVSRAAVYHLSYAGSDREGSRNILSHYYKKVKVHDLQTSFQTSLIWNFLHFLAMIIIIIIIIIIMMIQLTPSNLNPL